MLDVEIWVCVDANGDYAVGTDAAACEERFAEDVGTDPEVGRRVVRVVLKVPTPAVPTLTGTVPAEGGAELVAG